MTKYTEHKIEKMIETFPPAPGSRLEQKLEKAPWTEHALRQNRLVLIGTVASLVILILMGLTPQGRAIAQTIYQFFTRSDADTRLIATFEPTLNPQTDNATNPVISSKFKPLNLPFEGTCGNLVVPTCAPVQLRNMVDFPVLELESLPADWVLIGATGGPDLVVVVYQNPTGALHLTQRPVDSEDPFNWPVGASALVENVPVGANQGEYIQGAWTDAGQNEGTLVWNSEIPEKTLRWEQAGMRFTLQFVPAKTDVGIEPDKAAMVLYAGHLTTASSIPLQSPSADLLSPATLAVAANFQVLAPAWVPDRYTYGNGSFIPEKNVVCLFYDSSPGIEDAPALAVIESSMPLSVADIQLPPQTVNGVAIDIPLNIETPSLGGVASAMYVSNGLDITTLCGSKSLTANHALLWQKNGTSYIIAGLLDQYDGRGFITPLEMRRMAESLTGITTITAEVSDPGNLPSAEAATGLAGFKVWQPTLLPAGFTFSHAIYRSGGTDSLSDGTSEVILAYYATTCDSINRAHSILISENTVAPNTLDQLILGGGEWVKVNGLPAVYSMVCWESTNSGLGETGCITSLSWVDESGLRLDVNAYTSEAMDKQMLIEIAESMN